MTTCKRCGGPAEIVDKAPEGESGDVVRCVSEETCVALAQAVEALERAHNSAADAAQQFVRSVGPIKGRVPAEIHIPGYYYADLADAVQAWRDAGAALHKAQRDHAAARRNQR